MVYHAATRLVLGVAIIIYAFYYVTIATPTNWFSLGLFFLALGMFNIIRSLIILNSMKR